MTSNINKSSCGLMKVQPPAESFHQELSRPSLGVCLNVCTIIPCLWCVLSHQAGGKTPPLLVSHSAALVIGQSREFFNTTLAPLVLTRRDDQADKKKHDTGRGTQRGLPHCFYKTCHGLKHMTEQNLTQFISRTYLMSENSRKVSCV